MPNLTPPTLSIVPPSFPDENEGKKRKREDDSPQSPAAQSSKRVHVENEQRRQADNRRHLIEQSGAAHSSRTGTGKPHGQSGASNRPSGRSGPGSIDGARHVREDGIAPLKKFCLHVNEVGKILAKARTKDEINEAKYALSAAAQHYMTGIWKLEKSIDYAQLCNAFGKYPQSSACRAALGELAQAIVTKRVKDIGQQFNSQDFANAINGLSKAADDEKHGAHCRAALGTLAQAITDMTAQYIGQQFSSQAITNAINGLSKAADDEKHGAHCRAALGKLARAIIAKGVEYIGQQFSSQAITNAINGLSKAADDEKHGAHCRAALGKLARAIVARRLKDPGQQFNSQDIANAINGLSKAIDDPDDGTDCREALGKLARAIVARRLKDPSQQFNSQEIANAINGLSKAIDDPDDGADCREALGKLARAITAMTTQYIGQQFSSQHIANAINGLSKAIDDKKHGKHCREALGTLAQAITAMTAEDPGQQFSSRHIANAINGLSKAADDEKYGAHCRAALGTLAQAIVAKGVEYIGKRFNSQDIANAINGLSKAADDEKHGAHCLEALGKLARAITTMTAEDPGQQFSSQAIAQAINGLSKAADDKKHGAPARSAILFLLEAVTPGWLQQGNKIQLAQVSHGLGRLAASDAAEAGDREGARQGLRLVGACLAADPRKVAQFDAQHIALVLVAFDRAELLDDIARVAPSCLDRLQSLIAADALRQSDLETLGNVCRALLPVLSTATLREQRAKALGLLMGASSSGGLHLQAILARKLQLYLAREAAGGQAAAEGEAYGTRYPAYSFYQIVKVYAAAAAHWKKGARTYPKAARMAILKELKTWLRNLYKQVEPHIAADMSLASWNLIAQMDAAHHGKTDAILDALLASRLNEEMGSSAWTRFEPWAVFDRLDHEPEMPAPGVGLTEVRYYGLNGKPLANAQGQPRKEQRYSLWGMLTGMPIRYFQLNSQMSHFLLQRLIYVKDEGQEKATPYRLDCAGGSKVKGESLRVDAVARQAVTGERQRDSGYLVGIPLADTHQDAPYTAFARSLFPNKESYVYAQRMLTASPPNVPGVALEANDHVLHGRFSIALFPDTGLQEDHPFRIGDSLLCIHDGGGYIKESLARRMGWYDKLKAADGAQPYGGRTPSANLPQQALQHLPRDEAASAELRAHLQATAGELGSAGQVSIEEAYRGTVSALARGFSAIAVPIREEAGVHMVAPQRIRAAVDDSAEVMAGRAPYNGLRSLQVARVGSAARNARVQATQEILDNGVLFQYGMLFKADPPAAGEEQQTRLLSAKGVLFVVKDEDWPQAYGQVGIAMSVKDVKTDSMAEDKNRRPSGFVEHQGVGALHATEIWPQESAVGIVRRLQAQMGGDYDGDPLLVVPGFPKVRALRRRAQARLDAQAETVDRELSGRTFKSTKTFTPAIDAQGKFMHGRAELIMAARSPLLGRAATLQSAYVCLPAAAQQQVAEAAVRRLYDGVPADLIERMERTLKAMEGEDAESGEDPARAGRGASWGEDMASDLKNLQTDLRKYAGQASKFKDEVAEKVQDDVAELIDLLPQWAAQAGVPWPDAGSHGVRVRQGRPMRRAPEETEETDRIEQRLADLVEGLPRQVLSKTENATYVEGDPLLTMQLTLLAAVKAGEDGPKAPLGVALYERVMHVMSSVMRDLNMPQQAPNGKPIAAAIATGRFDADSAMEQAKEIPNLAGQILEWAPGIMKEMGLLDKAAQGIREREAPSTASGQAHPHQHTATRSRRQPDSADPAWLWKEAKDWLDKVRKDEPFITEGMRLIEQETKSQLLDLDKCFKEEEELVRKWQSRTSARTSGARPPRIGLRDKKDALRYTLQLNEEIFVETVEAVVRAMKKQNWEVTHVSNFFSKPEPQYKGLHLTVACPKDEMVNETVFEIQLHTGQSYRAKYDNRPDYEAWRKAEGDDKSRLDKKMKAHMKQVGNPAGVERIDRHWVSKVESGERDGHESDMEIGSDDSDDMGTGTVLEWERTRNIALFDNDGRERFESGYRLRLADGESVNCFMPPIKGGAPYHEAQQGAQCGRHVLNMLNWYVTQNEAHLMSDKALRDLLRRQLTSENVSSREIDARLTRYEFIDLPKVNKEKGLPALTYGAAQFDDDGELNVFEEAISPERIDRQQAVGVCYQSTLPDGSTDAHSVMLARDPHGRFRLYDPRKPDPEDLHAQSLSEALRNFMMNDTVHRQVDLLLPVSPPDVLVANQFLNDLERSLLTLPKLPKRPRSATPPPQPENDDPGANAGTSAGGADSPAPAKRQKPGRNQTELFLRRLQR